jgi:uncharacterized protein YjiS (DUF1127 family)
MTSQASPIKSARWNEGEGVISMIRRAAAAFIARRRRQNEIRLWMLNEHLLRDLGDSEADAEIAKLRDDNTIALGHFGFASLLFQNRRGAGRG